MKEKQCNQELEDFEKGCCLIEKLEQNHTLSKSEFISLLSIENSHLHEYLAFLAQRTAENYYHHKIYIRGLIEFSNYCKNDCYYCGIRKSNEQVLRYRLSDGQILDSCQKGYKLGFRTFVLQSGEDVTYSQKHLCQLIFEIKKQFPDCAVTLSLGEKSKDEYTAYFKSGASRYLLRQETVDPNLFALLKPSELSVEKRIQCIKDLKTIGYQTGCGFMVGAPYQTIENIAEDLLFIHEIQPEMIGIGPFIPHKDTPFKNKTQGTLELTLYLLGILRLIVPNALIPATTALNTIDKKGYQKGILYGANVIMPNLSPVQVRNLYSLYNNKNHSGTESAEGLALLKESINNLGYEIVVNKGDCVPL